MNISHYPYFLLLFPLLLCEHVLQGKKEKEEKEKSFRIDHHSVVWIRKVIDNNYILNIIILFEEKESLKIKQDETTERERS